MKASGKGYVRADEIAAPTFEKTGGAAFPLSHPQTNSPEEYAATSGMTLRDYFAAQALIPITEKLIVLGSLREAAGMHQSHKWCADLSYLLADAMLEARKS